VKKLKSKSAKLKIVEPLRGDKINRKDGRTEDRNAGGFGGENFRLAFGENWGNNKCKETPSIKLGANRTL
jgi:hypothetical protein